MRFIDSDNDIRMIVMWSGGIDSTFKLAYLLKETEYQIHAHHVHIINREGRSQKEQAACRALRPRLKAIRGFTYTESRIDHRQHRGIPFDLVLPDSTRRKSVRPVRGVQGSEAGEAGHLNTQAEGQASALSGDDRPVYSRPPTRQAVGTSHPRPPWRVAGSVG
jgi:hypothetical protein